jgi:hypothetical protein
MERSSEQTAPLSPFAILAAAQECCLARRNWDAAMILEAVIYRLHGATDGPSMVGEVR